MVTVKWYEEQAAEEWIADEITTENVSQAEKIVSDEMMMKLAACCTAVYEGYNQGQEFKLRVNQILASETERHCAAMFLVYHNATTKTKANSLLQKQHLRIHFYDKVNSNKERTMEQENDKPLTEKQIEFARTNKKRVLQDVEEFKDYLQKQDSPEWWLKRRFFSFAANSFNKHKRDEYQMQQQQQKQTLSSETIVAEVQPQQSQKI